MKNLKRRICLMILYPLSMYGDGSPILSDGSQILAGCPTTQLNSDTTWRYSQIQRLKAQSYKTEAI